MTLRELIKNYGTDKASDHQCFGLNYADYYERHVGPLLNAPGNVLEIGIYQGASLRLWRDWFTKGEIHGVDINDVSQYIKDEARIRIHQGNARDMGDMENVGKAGGPFKLIVDDGSHSLMDIFPAFEQLWQYLAVDGWYVIEDLHHHYNLGEGGRFMTWFEPLLEKMHRCMGQYKTFTFYPMILFIQKAI